MKGRTTIIAVHCRILNVGPDSEVQCLLRQLLHTEELVSVQQVETGSIALDVLSRLPESELPHLVVIPFQLPILTGLDFIAAMRSHPQLRSIPVVVWGAEIQARVIDQIHKDGAAGVLLGHFGTAHVNALWQFCRKLTATDASVTKNPSQYAITFPSQRTGEQGGRDVRLGTLFVWTGCFSAVLWICAFLEFASSYKLIDLAPLPVYGGLACAGFSLMSGSLQDRVKARH